MVSRVCMECLAEAHWSRDMTHLPMSVFGAKDLAVEPALHNIPLHNLIDWDGHVCHDRRSCTQCNVRV